MLETIKSGVRVLYKNPYNETVRGVVRFHAQQQGFWVVSDELPARDTLELVSEADIVAVL